MKNDDRPPSAGRQLLLKAVNRVWTELMHSKRQMLEDIFKVSLPCNDRGHVDIATARPALEEPALKSWQNHLGEGHWGNTLGIQWDITTQSFPEPCLCWICGILFECLWLIQIYITRSAIWELLLFCKGNTLICGPANRAYYCWFALFPAGSPPLMLTSSVLYLLKEAEWWITTSHLPKFWSSLLNQTLWQVTSYC